MAIPQNQTPTQQRPVTQTQTSSPETRGKPAAPKSKDPKQQAVFNLQYAVDRACNFIHDGGSSYARRAKAAAAKEIPKETVLKGFVALEAALADCRKAIERAYSPDEKRAPTHASRVQLG